MSIGRTQTVIKIEDEKRRKPRTYELFVAFSFCLTAERAACAELETQAKRNTVCFEFFSAFTASCLSSQRS
jgi:hypothetical protein